MPDSVSDLIYILVFGLLMLLVNRKKKNKGPVVEKNKPLENQNEEAKEKEPEVVSLGKIRQMKPLFKDKESLEEKTYQNKELLPQPKSQNIPSESNIPALKEHDFSKELFSLEKPESEKEINIVDKASAKDMVILSAIYFNPYN